MPDLTGFKTSYSHGTLKLNDVVYGGVSNVSFSQGIERSAVYGTSKSPLGKSQGQVGLGEGTITFSDAEEASIFFDALEASADDLTNAVFSVDWTTDRGNGTTVRSYEFLGCSVTSISGDFEQGADALSVEMPFDFLVMKRDGVEIAKS